MDRYLDICEQMGTEPDINNLPVNLADFPYEVQIAIMLFRLMSDVWDGTAGVYLGKDWSIWPYLVKEYEVEDSKEVFHFAKMYEAALIETRHERSARERKAAERKAHGGNSVKHQNFGGEGVTTP